MKYRLLFSLAFKSLNLAQQYALASLLVFISGMLAIGWWVNKEIETGVIQYTAATAALYLNSFITPELQELARQSQLSNETITTLDHFYRETPLGKQVVSFKIWNPQGRILYSNNPSLIGRVFPMTPSNTQAWNGIVTAEFSSLDYAEHAFERELNIPLLEIYSPVRERLSDRIIAVAEFYNDASVVTKQLIQARLESWLVVVGVTLMMFVLLFGIVYRGSWLIERQRQELHTRIKQLSELLGQNKALNERVGRASSRAIELNERFLRRVSAELHDGPAQALGIGLLRLDAVIDNVNDCTCGNIDQLQAKQNLNTLRDVLDDALQEIRNLSAGLAVPELTELSLSQSLQRLRRTHRLRTGTEVALSIDEIPEQVCLPLKIGIYRFVQEALTNAYRHGDGKDQRVRIGLKDNELRVEVSDSGPGFAPDQVLATVHNTNNQLGLLGMRERIESLGGHFYLESAPGQGTHVSAYLPLHNDRS